ncbi:hypothetical protein [Streptomyces sp. NPDC058092]|uniref:hypothetical protein n=1 Tax=Streptomyces sp. NPDC058092 TaxID=3346336 RepID=UPI0036EB3EC1
MLGAVRPCRRQGQAVRSGRRWLGERFGSAVLRLPVGAAADVGGDHAGAAGQLQGDLLGVLHDPDGLIEAELPLDREPYECLVKAVLARTRPGKDLAPDPADHSLAAGVHARHLWRAEQHVHVFGLEDGVEGVGVLAVAVAENEAERLDACAEVGGQIAGLLGRPPARWGGR